MSYVNDGYARLIGATAIAGGTSKEIINLDKSGNRTSYTLNTYTVNSATNTLDQYTNFTGGETSTYTYDYNGNLKTIGTKVFTYDYNNRLIQYTIGASIRVKYLYDIFGRRIEKIDYSKSATNPESTVYIYNGDNIQSEYMTTSILVNGTGTLTPITLKKNYLNSIGTDAVLAYDAEQQVNPTSTGKTTVRYYYHTNQLGSIIAISTSTGQVVQKYTYNAYGKPYIYSGSTLTPLSSYTGTLYGNTRLYTGREYDRETGYYYLRARTYSPDLGRFLSRDPIGQNDQVNLYTYVANSPLKYVDRMGREKVLIFLGENYDPSGVDYQIQKYLDQGIKRKNILIKDVFNVDDFNNESQPYKGHIKEIVYISHGTKNSIESGTINRKNVTQLQSLKSNPGEQVARLILISCNTGKGENPIAQDVANQLGIEVEAPNGFVDIGRGEGFGQVATFPGAFDPFRVNGEPSFANIDNYDTFFGLFGGKFNIFNPLK